jgi:hypothetical protein
MTKRAPSTLTITRPSGSTVGHHFAQEEDFPSQAQVWDALVGHAGSIGFEVAHDQRGTENGYCEFVNNRIAVRPDVSAAQAVKTLIHELAHALLHSETAPPSREVAEVEVESVAFVVCDAIGLDTGEYSFS